MNIADIISTVCVVGILGYVVYLERDWKPTDPSYISQNTKPYTPSVYDEPVNRVVLPPRKEIKIVEEQMAWSITHHTDGCKSFKWCRPLTEPEWLVIKDRVTRE